MADQPSTIAGAQDDTPFMRLLTAFANYESATFDAAMAEDDPEPAEEPAELTPGERAAQFNAAIAQLESALNAYVDERVKAVLKIGAIPPGYNIIIAKVDPQS